MNWNKIKEKYPKSEALIDKCIRTDRDLYDFFDEQGIYINAYKYSSKWWAYDIMGIGIDESEIQFKTRTEAEEKAFEKAFEILENKIIKEQK